VGGADLHKRFSARKVGRKPKGGRVAPILDGPGAAPPSSVTREARPQSPKGVRLWPKADAPGGEKGALLVAASDRRECGACEHPVAAGEVP
jgi:hypothetical protein